MINKCQLVMATGGTIAQDLTMQWCALNGFMQDLSLMVIDEGQQYGTDREIATISLLKQQPLILWTDDAQQTPGGIARTAPNAKRSFFLWSAPVAFRRVALETPKWTSRDSNHHRHSVRAGKTNAIPTEPSGRLPMLSGPEGYYWPNGTASAVIEITSCHPTLPKP